MVSFHLQVRDTYLPCSAPLQMSAHWGNLGAKGQVTHCRECPLSEKNSRENVFANRMKDISPKLSAFSGSVPGLWFNIMDCPWAVSPFVLIQMGFNYPPVFIPFDSYYFVPCTSRFTTFYKEKKEVLQRSNMQSYADPYHLYPVPWNIWEDHLLALCFHSEPSWIQMARPPQGSEILCQHCRFSPKYVCSRTEQRHTFFHV